MEGERPEKVDGRVTDIFQQTKKANRNNRDRKGDVELNRGEQHERGSKGYKKEEEEEGPINLDLDADVDPDERTLRAFDLTSKYGPCTGMSRIERWDRAAGLGLNPPQQVRALLLSGR